MLRPPVNRGSIAPGVLSTNRQARVGCASKMIRVQHANSSAHMEILRHVWFSAVPLGFRPLPFSQYLLTQTHTRSVLYISLSHTHTLSLFSIKRAKDVQNCIFSNQLACGTAGTSVFQRRPIWVHLTPIRRTFQRDIYVRHVLMFRSAYMECNIEKQKMGLEKSHFETIFSIKDSQKCCFKGTSKRALPWKQSNS